MGSQEYMSSNIVKKFYLVCDSFSGFYNVKC